MSDDEMSRADKIAIGWLALLVLMLVFTVGMAVGDDCGTTRRALEKQCSAAGGTLDSDKHCVKVTVEPIAMPPSKP